jgi:hypothetical protein
VLMIRRLVLPWGDARAAREALDRLRRTAVHPARHRDGPVDAHAEAVAFDDEVEALMCLSLDVLRGIAQDHWWWQGRLPAGPLTAARCLPALWRAEARWVPAVLGALLAEAPARAADLVTALGDEGCFEVLRAVLATFSPSGEESDPSLAPTVPELAPEDVAVPAVVRMLEHRVSRAARSLLAVGAILDRLPARAVRPGFARWAWLGATEPDAPAEAAPETGPAIPTAFDPDSSRIDESARRGPTRRRAARPQPQPVDRRPPPDDGARVAAARLPVAAQMALDDEDPQVDDDAPLAKVVPMRPGTDHRPRPGDDQGRGSPPGRNRPWVGSGPATETGMASMLFVVNLMRWFDLADDAADTSVPSRSGWAVVEALARWMQRQLPPTVRRSLLRDPLWRLLAELDGRPDGVRTPVRLGHHTRPVRRFLERSGVGPTVFTRSGTVLVSRTHVDVVLPLSDVDLAARRTGLDQDPGWVGELGRIVLFHFEDGE